MNNKEISIPIKLDYADKTIEQLEKIKRLIQEIKELDNNFNLSNVIEINNNTILVFNTNCMLEGKRIKEAERTLTNKLQCKCVILDARLQLDKAIKRNEVDYKTITLYKDGEVCKEETVQYK